MLTTSTISIENAAFEPSTEHLRGIAKPWRFDQALRELLDQLSDHVRAVEDRARSAHRDALSALERGDASLLKPQGTPSSAEPTTVPLGEHGVVTRRDEEVVLTIRVNIRTRTASYVSEIPEPALATLQAR
jgi:hypothetical protein